ncbi:Hypothetical protein CINCED_3A007915 [Cinara cedri]|uniref:Reverse transcriptase domain n=1 Tax=Cinara cedri TaxID=506608 RepID=A0A5E4NDV5_9HEMI|nr:Hypothetical protein CINCED_3A007915 [Cinara cedri]
MKQREKLLHTWCAFLDLYLAEQFRVIHKEEITNWRNISAGVPQGSSSRTLTLSALHSRYPYKQQINDRYVCWRYAPVMSFVLGQRIQWLGHIMIRGENDKISKELEWKPLSKKPRGKPRKILIHIMEEDLITLEMEDWRKR